MKNSLFFCAGLFLLVVAFSGCIGDTSPDGAALTGNSIIQNESGNAPARAAEKSLKAVKVEIYHFHRTTQCPTCIMVGKLAEETVNEYFSEDVKAGKVVFGHINIELPENKEIVDRYGPSGSSLYIGAYYENGTFEKEENTNVWYKVGSREEYLPYLKEIIGQKLGRS